MTHSMFIGIEPPADLSAAIRAWQVQLHHDITAPHVTVKPPQGMSAEVAARCRAVCPQLPAFALRLHGVRTFDSRVIYLDAQGEGLHHLHWSLVEASGLPATSHERGGYTPHLTMVLSRRPMNVSWPEALASARAEFGSVDRTYTVEAAVLYVKDRPGQPYRVAERWPLLGG
ncbi:2'-5' RNA ligase family protein [Deinococcus sonorensis]|uniref:2'-5' RNA ligase family protein n=2 Tax=Deinococcus sonorensis TaxID=309891 RepID=A0AAU7UAU5_9DEIO